MTGVTVKCCQCGEGFDERALEGAWLDRRCPRCHGRVSEELYDEQAHNLLAEGVPARKLKRIAQARYYTSEWFRLACAGQGSTAPGKGRFGLSPGYDPETGSFRLIPTDDDRSPEGGLGISAEFFVFDAIRAEIARDSSPLAGARLVPHLVFPWLPGQKPKQWGARHRAEIDCVLLARSCAVIVEVKRRSHHVKVSKDFQHIRERNETSNWKSAPDALEQVERGASSLAERQRVYAPERIFRMVVYVDPVSFECANTQAEFRDGLFVGCLEGDGKARMVKALDALVDSLDAIADGETIEILSTSLLQNFGNTTARRKGTIAVGDNEGTPRRLRRTDAMLSALERQMQSPRSPLHGGRLLRNLTCEVEVGKRGQEARTKQMTIAGLLLTRTHAVLIDARRWPVHVNTHAPFATVYTGDPADGAEHVDADIRHDWDLEEIHYRNRSGSLTLLTFAAKCITELDGYRERNRVCTLNIFLDPTTYFTNCDDFRSRTFIGYWKGRDENIIGALERLVADARPIMSQNALDELADGLF